MQTPTSLTPTLACLRTFQGIPGPEIHALVSAGRVVNIARGERLAQAGDPAGTGWLVVQGRMRLEAGTPRQSLGDVWPGELVGEHGLFGPAQTHVTDIVAASDTILLALDRGTCHATGLRNNRAMAALQRHTLMVTARRLHTLDTSRARLAAPTPQKPDVAPAEPDGQTLMGWLRGLFGGEE